jgi:beta-glucosidase
VAYRINSVEWSRTTKDLLTLALGLSAAVVSFSSCRSSGSTSETGGGGSSGGTARGAGGDSAGAAGQGGSANGSGGQAGTLATGATGGSAGGSGGQGIDGGGQGGASGAIGGKGGNGGNGGNGAIGGNGGNGAIGGKGAAGAGGASGGSGALGGLGGTAVATAPYPTQACLDRADALVAQMTANEKYAQMMQIERAAPLTAAQVTQYGVGSVFSQGGSAPTPNTPTGWADMTDGYRQAALVSRLKIPIIYGADEVHGIGTVAGATVFPHNIGLGATGDVPLVKQIAQVTAAEAQGVGVQFLFSPVVAVARDERWGRTYESFGETSVLPTAMGVAMTQGLQFTDTGAPTGLLADAKHYLGDGGTANGMNGGLTAGDETALRAIHLAPYQSVVPARVGAVMPSYSSWQGVKMHINHTMITDVLKTQLGFGGFVNSDFDACFQLGLAGTAAGEQQGLGECLNAGVDMFMLERVNITTSLGFFTALVPATVPQARIDDAVRRIVAVKCEMGLFSSTGLADRTLTAQVGSTAHRMVARKAVQESMVVLQNSGGVLPLAKTAHVALGGKSADNTGNQCGGWTITWQGTSGNGVPGATSVRQAMQAEIGTANVTYSATMPNTTGATVGVAVIGETPYAEGMGDRTSLALDPADVAVVQGMKQAGLKTVVVLISGRPMILDTILPYADAIVAAWLPGSEGGGITDVLFGDAHPTGKLPCSWPKSMAQIPINQGDATYDPLYPYAFGLTY